MKKSNPVMRCAICHRPMARAAALLKGLPVGPVCAAGAGLLPGRAGAAKPQGELDLVPATLPHAAPVRDELTIDMFEG